jgi:predicted PurR-regulated permease PerM
MKTIRKVIIIATIVFFLGFIVYTAFYIIKGDRESLMREYAGIISEIRYLYGNRGIADIKINDQWIPLGVEDSRIQGYIQLGDSIVKESGTVVIYVYRKNSKGEWEGRLFK